MNQKHSRHQGLILLIVLGMLSLFSLLAISFMVITSQSRRSNAGRASRDFRGTAPEKLLDDAIRPVLRGTTDPSSFLRGQSLLADLHGSQEQPLRVRVRNTMFGVTANMLPPNNPQNYNQPITHNSTERPLLLAGRFLRIPIVMNNRPAGGELPRDNVDFPTTMNPYPVIDPRSDLPFENDAWTSRVATFLSGPLQGQSFRIVRYIGFEFIPAATPAPSLAQSYSIVIDLQDAAAGLATIGTTTRSIAEWASQLPIGSNQAAKRGLFLCYGTVPPSGTAQLSDGYEILINAMPLNSHGVGINGNLNDPNGLSRPDPIAPAGSPIATAVSSADVNLLNIPTAFQPNRTVPNTQPLVPFGDADEDYDAADYQNWYLSHSYAGATDSSMIIPSFHRAALINYIVNAKNPRDYEDGDLYVAVMRILRAAGRPLSVRLEDRSVGLQIVTNPDFDGGNQGQFTTLGDERSTQLNVAWDSQSSWQDTNNPTGVAAFLDWVRWLTKGPWDVDNDGNGVYDGIWIDPNLPLITSREGKLLKALVSYTIESLDSRLDLNATGNLQQTAAPNVYDAPTDANYAIGPGQYIPQGFGYGPADVSLRHLFGIGTAGQNAYRAFLQDRYGGRMPNASGVVQAETLPGTGINDVRSQLNQRELRPGPLGGVGYTHSALPAVPPAVFGRLAIGVDRLGNPVLNNSGTPQVVNEPYESGILSGGRGDTLYSITEWERMTRLSNWDRSSLPRRLNSSIAAANLVTPRSRHLRHIPASVSRNTGRQSTSMYELVREMFAFNPPRDGSNNPITVPLSYQAYRELFPIEFQQGRGFNINRVLGNGVDEDGDGNVDEIEEQLKNGIDENNNGVVDEAAERDWTAYQQRTIVSNGSAPLLQNPAEAPIPGQVVIGGTAYHRGIFDGFLDPTFEALANAALNGGANTDSDGDGQRDIDTLRYHFGAQSRQLLARNLYCLAMLVLPRELYLSNVNDPSGNPAPSTGDERARRIAQWAVNVVDFRDADSAMTRFPYDPDPFTPKPNGAYWVPDPSAGEVVWGMEQPDVILTESLATHDLRVRDTMNDSSGDTRSPTGDDDLDQVRTPEASAFLELMALRTTSGANATNVPGVAGGTHVTIGGLNQLDLSALSPAIDVEMNSTTLSTQYPVYRVVFSRPETIDRSSGNAQPHGHQPTNNPTINPQTPLGLQEQAQQDDRLTATYQISNDPNRQNGLAWDTNDLTELAPVEIDRVLIFAPWSSNLGIPDLPSAITPDQYENRVYSNSSSADITLFGGQYLVVGPRETTFFGSRDLGPGNYEHSPNPHRIALGDSYGLTPALVSGDFTVFGTDQANTTPNVGVGRDSSYMRPIQTMIASQSVPWSATVTGQGGQVYQRPERIGLNISAPYRDAYYPAPREVHDSSDTMDDALTGAPGYASREADAYYDFDAGVGSLPGAFDATRGPLSDPNLWPIRDSESQTMPQEPGQGTVLNYCTAYLQRLADPERPWHRDLNPYITLDWIPMDLTVFNGEDTQPNPAPEFAFNTRQKTGAMADVAGGFLPLAGTGDRKTFLSYDSTEPQQSTPVVGSDAHFDVELPLDWNRGPASRPTQTDAAHFATLGYLNSTFTLAGETSGSTFANDYVGAPMDVPSSLFWLDRAYTNAAEMAWAPLSAPGQLMQEFSAPNGAPSSSTGPASAPTAPSDYVHLPNFMQPIAPQNGSNNQLAPATLFDLVETPSPWIDAEEFVSPSEIALTPVNPNLQQQAINYIFEPHRAPYNRLSNFTEPGRININDVAEPAVWQGIVWNSLQHTERENVLTSPGDWQRVLESRRGYLTAGGGNIPNANPLLHPEVPTQFAGVFKSTFAAGMVPPTRSATPPPPLLDGAARDPTSGALQRPSGVTLLRPDATGAPLFRPADTAYASMTARHPYMDYQPFTRLQNLVTTRSNVFSVRVTVGFFEYNSATGIGREYGIDEGTAQRHKAFYVIDRSIPVGYQEGLDLNTDQCILMRRIIE